jgi:hypothetical protein
MFEYNLLLIEEKNPTALALTFIQEVRGLTEH